MTPLSSAGHRYLRRGGGALLAHVLTVVPAAIWAGRSSPPHGPLIWPITLASGLAVLAAVVATHHYLKEETDRLQRAIQIEALIWAIGVTFGVATVWGLLEPLARVPAVPSYCAFAVFSSVAISVQLARRRFPRASSKPGLDGT